MKPQSAPITSEVFPFHASRHRLPATSMLRAEFPLLRRSDEAPAAATFQALQQLFLTFDLHALKPWESGDSK